MAGTNQHVLRLSTSVVITLRLRDGETSVPGPHNRQPRFELEGKRVSVFAWSSENDGGMRFFLAKPGHYVIRVEGVPGFRTSAQFEADLAPGSPVVIEVPLQRDQ